MEYVIGGSIIMNRAVKMVLVDYRFFQSDIIQVLQAEETFQIVATSDDYSTVSSILKEKRIDLLLTDITLLMKYQTMLKKELNRLEYNVKIVALASSVEDQYVLEAIQFGVDGYLLKDMNIFTFLKAIKTVHQDKTYIHPAVTRPLVEAYRSLLIQQNKYPTPVCTKRENEVLQLLAKGQSNRHIAQALAISEKTVKNHISNMLRKMKVNDRTQAVVTAIRNNWITL